MKKAAVVVLLLIIAPLAMAMKHHRVRPGHRKKPKELKPELVADEGGHHSVPELIKRQEPQLSQQSIVDGELPQELVEEMNNMAHMSPAMAELSKTVAGTPHLQEVFNTIYELYNSLYSQLWDEKNLYNRETAQRKAEIERLTGDETAKKNAIALDETNISTNQASLRTEESNNATLHQTLHGHQSDHADLSAEHSVTSERCDNDTAHLNTMIAEHESSLGHLTHVKAMLMNSSLGHTTLASQSVEISSLLRKSASAMSATMKSQQAQQDINALHSQAVTALAEANAEQQQDYQNVADTHAKRLRSLLDELISGVQISHDGFKQELIDTQTHCTTTLFGLSEKITEARNAISTTSALIRTSLSAIATYQAAIASHELQLAGNQRALADIQASIAAVHTEQAQKDHALKEFIDTNTAETKLLNDVTQYMYKNYKELVPTECSEKSIGCPRCKVDADCDDGVYCNGVETCDKYSGYCRRQYQKPCGLVANCDEYTSSCGCVNGHTAQRGSVIVKNDTPAASKKLSPNPEVANPEIGTATDYSYCLWLHPNYDKTYYSTGTIFSRQHSVDGGGVVYTNMYIGSGGYVGVYIASGHDQGTNTYMQWVGAQKKIPSKQWSYACFSVSGKTGKARMWVQTPTFFNGYERFMSLLPLNSHSEFFMSPNKGPWNSNATPADVEVRHLEFYAYALDPQDAVCTADEGVPDL